MWEPRHLAGFCLLIAAAGGTSRAIAASPQLFIGTTRNITRHAIVGRGFIERNADLNLTQTSAPIAVGPDGALYATIHNLQFRPSPQILVYRRDKTQAYRHFYLHPPFNFSSCAESYGDYATALAVDSQGFVYLGYWNGFSYGPSFTDIPLNLVPDTTNAPCSGIQVFPPNATEDTQPILYFALPSNKDWPIDMRVSDDGSLYVLDAATKSIFVYANPSTQPTLTRSMTWLGAEQFTGLALDDQRGLMYVASACNSPGCFFGRLFTFPEQFTASQTPLASFYLPESGFSFSVESFDSKLFVSSGNFNSEYTLVYNKVGPLRNRPIEKVDVGGPLVISR